MQDQIGSIVLRSLTALFAGYGIRELVLCFRMEALRAWGEGAAIAAGSMFVAAVFSVMTIQFIDDPTLPLAG
jgi:hypothetical protein